MNLSSLDSLTELIGAAAIRSGAAFALDDIAGLDARARVMHVVRILHAISQTDPWIAKILNTQQAIPQLRAETHETRSTHSGQYRSGADLDCPPRAGCGFACLLPTGDRDWPGSRRSTGEATGSAGSQGRAPDDSDYAPVRDADRIRIGGINGCGG